MRDFLFDTYDLQRPQGCGVIASPASACLPDADSRGATNAP
jgi:hypothetical protein